MMKERARVACGFSLVASLAIIAGGCAGGGEGALSPVVESYVHKYGISVAKNEWESRGKDGKVITQRKDGVTVTRQYSAGELSGETTYTLPYTPLIARTERYERGELIAECDHYTNGGRKRERCYLPNHTVAVTTWYENGTPCSRETFQGDLLVSGEYLSPTNVIEGRVEAKDGLRIVRSSQGELLSEDEIANGQMVTRTTFLATGEPESITPYFDGAIHGIRKSFLPGGVPKLFETYVLGSLHGYATSFLNGEKHAEIPYENGYKHGLERIYGPGGSLVEEISWLRDRKHGADLFLLESERKVDWYHQGQLVSKAIFDRLNPQPS